MLRLMSSLKMVLMSIDEQGVDDVVEVLKDDVDKEDVTMRLGVMLTMMLRKMVVM